MTSIKSASTVLEPDNHHHHQQQQQQQPNDDDSSRTSKNEKYKITYNKKAESEFFVDNSALAGFTGERILYMAIRELLENALDSCESFSILPSITVSLKNFDQTNDLWELTCKDNGTGISPDKLPVAVCSFLTSAKYMEKQQRGLFGVGLKMVAAFSTKDTDYPVKVWNKSFNEAEEYYFELRTDIGTNRPIILKKKISTPQESQIESSSGFKIAVILRAKLVPITRNKIYEYVTETSIVNPYSSIIFETDDGVFQFDRRTSIMPQPAREILPHPSDMDLKTLKKAISKFHDQKISLPKILASSFQKLSYEKAKELVTKSGLELKSSNINFSEHDLIKIVNMCKKTKFQNPNTDHLSPIGQEILTIGMMSEYTIVTNKGNDASINSNSNTDDNVNPSLVNESSTQINNAGSGSGSQNTEITNSKTNLTFKNSSARSNFSVKVLKPVLTAYTSRTCVINNRPTIVETGLAYGGDIPSFKLYRFANKIPLLYDEGSDVAREVISEVQINKMGITKKQAKEQFSASKESKKDRAIEVLPLHIFFHVCSTKIPYKTAGKESIASEGELKYYMKSCLSELYRKLSTQIRKELKLKEAENKLRLYKHYLPFIVESINESLGIKNSKLSDSFSKLIENHLTKRTNMDELISSTGNSSSHIPSLVESDNIAVEEHTTKKMNNNNNNSNNSNSNSSGKGGSSNNNNSSSSHSHSGGNKDPKKFNGDIINTNNSNNNQKKKKKTREQKIELTKNFKSNTNNNKIKSYNAFDLKKHRDEIKKKSSNKKTTTPIPVKKSISTIHKHTEKTLKNSPKKNPEQTKTKTKDMQSIMSPYDKRVNKGKRK